jgi:flagellar hook-basal body complex protein FliE
MDNKINYNASDFIDGVEKFLKRSLHRKAEMIAIYKASVDSNQMDIFRDLCFTAKYLVGMMRVLQEGGNNRQVSNLEDIKKDFSVNLNKAIEQIKQIIAYADESQKKYFEEEFFVRIHTGLTNLNELLADLESAKLYLNYLKREIKN